MNTSLFEYVLRLGDNALINGQRLAEWCGHGPFLEEDVAMANAALDLIGRARLLLTYAGEIEGEGRTEDDLAYFRNERNWRNCLIMELPIGDFAFTMARQYLVDEYDLLLYRNLQNSADQAIAGIAGKTVKECDYHVRRSGDWILRLGDGTEESHRRIQRGLDEVWPYAAELFNLDAIDREMQETGIAPGLDVVQETWLQNISAHLARATLQLPDTGHRPGGGREGLHTEHMGYLLAEMQSVQRACPGQQW